MTVSGHSAGCQFSHTMQVIYSESIHGAGLMECGPYSTDFGDFHAPGASTESLDDTAFANIEKNEADGGIDSTENLKDVAAYIVGGTEDESVYLFAV